MTVVALTGRKGSGKDAAAQGLVSRGFTLVKFADALKLMLATFLEYQGASKETVQRMLEGDLKEERTLLFGGHTPRHAMQTLGTEWGREYIYSDVWADATVRRCLTIENAIITDMRFYNELAAVRRMGGQAFRIVRPGLQANEFSNHPSEQFIDKLAVDGEIINDGSIEDLQAALVKRVFQ